MEAAFAQIQGRPEAARSLVYRHLHPDGGMRWVDAWLSHGIEDPQVGGIVINLRDVTSRVESDRALQESQERYRAIVETAQERIWVVSQKIADIAGRSTEELYSRGILELLDVRASPTDAQPRCADRSSVAVRRRG